MFSSNKFFAVTHLLVFITYTIQQESDSAFMKRYDVISDGCAKEQGLDDDYVNEIWSGKQFPNDTKLKCFFSCLNLKLGVMDDTGDIKEDVLEKVSAEFYNMTLAEKIGDVCDIAKDGDLCQTAFDCMTCVLNMQNGHQG